MAKKAKVTVEPTAATPQRKLEEIQAEYQQHCATAGDKQYRIKILGAELDQLNQKMLELNQEATKSQPAAPAKV